MGIARVVGTGFALLILGCSPGSRAPFPIDVAVRPGLLRSIALDDRGRPDPDSLTESCRGEMTWFAVAALSSGSREMGCEPLRPILWNGRISAAREVCHQGNVIVTRTIRLMPGSPSDHALEAFDEVTDLQVTGRRGREVSRTRSDWLGVCSDPQGRLLGGHS